MVEEMAAIHSNGTWDLVPLPPGKQTVGLSLGVYSENWTDGHIDRLKSCLVAKGYAQIFGLDYGVTFYLVAKITCVLVFIIGLFIGQILKMHSQMVNCRKKFIWINPWFSCSQRFSTCL